MDRLQQILSSYNAPAYAVSLHGHVVLVANKLAERYTQELAGTTPLTGQRLVEVLTHAGIDYESHPAFRAIHARGPHSRHYPHRGGVTTVASRLPDVPSRPPCVLVSAHATDIEPLAAANHLRIVSAFQIAAAIDDMERSLKVALTMLTDAQVRLRDMGDLWQDRTEAYAEEEPAPFAEFSLLDTANERSERNEAEGIDLLSDLAVTVKPSR